MFYPYLNRSRADENFENLRVNWPFIFWINSICIYLFLFNNNFLINPFWMKICSCCIGYAAYVLNFECVNFESVLYFTVEFGGHACPWIHPDFTSVLRFLLSFMPTSVSDKAQRKMFQTIAKIKIKVKVRIIIFIITLAFL